MPTNTAQLHRYVGEELAELRDHFTPEEERLFEAGRLRELAKKLMGRALQRNGVALGLLIALEFVPIAYVLFALLVFGLEPWTAAAGFAVLFLFCGVLPARMFLRSHRFFRAAARAWAVAHEAEVEGLPDGVDVVELADRMDTSEHRLFEAGRLRELAERLEEEGSRGVRFSRAFRIVPLSALAGALVLGAAMAREDPAHAVIMLVLAGTLGAVLHAVVRSGRKAAEKARTGARLRERLPGTG